MNASATLVVEQSPGSGHLVEVKTLRTFKDVEEIRDVWCRLQRHPNSELDFYLAIARSRAEVIRPHVIVIYRNGQADALLIGRLEQKRLNFSVGYKRCCSLNAQQLTFIYEGFLGSQSLENAAKLIAEIEDSLRQGEAALAVMNLVNTESPVHTYAKQLTRGLKAPYCAAPQAHWSLSLPNSFEEFLGRFSAKVRRNRRQEAARLHRAFPDGVRIECLSEPSDVDRMVSDAEEIARKTYHRGLGVGFSANEENRRRFLDDAKQGRLRTYVLYLQDRPVAFWSGTLYGETFYASFTGYDPAYRKHSPGAFLFLHVVETLCNDVTKRFDFGFGDAWYKEHFCDCEWQESSIHFFAPTVAGLRLKLLQVSTSFINTKATSILTRSGLILKTKRIWRSLHVSRKIEISSEPELEGKAEDL